MLGCYPAPNPLLPQVGGGSPLRKQPRQLPAPAPRLGLAGRRGWAVNSPIVHIYSAGWDQEGNLPPRPELRAGGEGWGGTGSFALQEVKAWTRWWRRARGDSAWESRQPGLGNLKMSREWVLVCLSLEGSPRDEEPRMERGAGAQSE